MEWPGVREGPYHPTAESAGT